MPVSTNAEHFFQTSTSLAEHDRKHRKSSNTLGDPIRLRSKLLALSLNSSLDPSGQTILLAGADGDVRIVNGSSNEVVKTVRVADAPITCLASYSDSYRAGNGSPVQVVFAGGWDKTITRFDALSEGNAIKTVSQVSFKAHSDFVKCLLVAPTPDKQVVLLSGGADGDINIWSLDGKRLASIKPQSRGVEFLALDPFSTADAPRVFFSTSQREICTFTLPASTSMSGGIQISEPIVQHETSVYKLVFDGDGDLWTASADKTAKRLVRENNFVADTTLVHPDFVRDIAIHEQSALAITACRDEEVRVWNSGTSQLLHVFTGHYEEVTGLALVGNTVLSISIDATMRRWSVAPQDLTNAIEEANNPKLLEDNPEPKNDFGGLTEEEEAELRALMEEEETDVLEKMARDEQ